MKRLPEFTGPFVKEWQHFGATAEGRSAIIAAPPSAANALQRGQSERDALHCLPSLTPADDGSKEKRV